MRKLFAFKNKLFSKIFLLMSISVFVPLGLLGLLSYDKSKNQLESVTSQLLQDNLQLNAKQINSFFKNVENEADKMVASRELRNLLGEDIPSSYSHEVEFINRMVDVVIQLKGTYELYIFPKNIASYPNYWNLIKLSKVGPDSEYFQRAYQLQRKGIWIHVWDDHLNKPIFIYIRAIFTNNQKPLGIIALQIPDSIIRKELASPSSFKNYMFVMVDDQNLVISHPSAAAYMKTYVPEESWYKAEMPLSEVGWKLIAAVPQKDVSGSIDKIKTFTVWIVAGSLCLIVAFLTLIVRSFTIPVKNLVRQMAGVRIGRLIPYHLVKSREDEVGQLIRGYNQMILGMLELLHTTKEMESEKRQLELQTLNHQINPHFFYNTLDSIKWRAESVQENKIAAMVTKLANLLRFSLNNGEEWTTVEREIEHARNYLDIEHLRSNRTFQVYVQVDPEILKMKVMKLMLQPLVENAIKHGVSHLSDGKGKIRLTAKRREQDIIFIVEDNGPGIHVPLALNLNETTDNDSPRGIGLSNVHKRLQLHFGNDYGLLIDSTQTSGFRVVVRHPLSHPYSD
ncbi:cache domain-containing sensor histidine kinase [Paenibacillus alginolyticus]|uniref:histidine kinase n=1 Tax=Paenibacillus alginolyticus TaxID=59839 RepID=A0ABT4GNC9_9BACL|nr:sensor histidine kinase [Paenibacillus alginolyticus]MCY9697703.1 sensor histidine kinase [Paenibacillus alginolyticus]MEC0146737.1 sensor histidine kinase [Paenibacillus alginolyticus]